ncbi:MAG: hypothetical protein Q7S00_07105, partial [bacterium]|nr:hypothetical protein [bacterium]
MTAKNETGGKNVMDMRTGRLLLDHDCDLVFVQQAGGRTWINTVTKDGVHQVHDDQGRPLFGKYRDITVFGSDEMAWFGAHEENGAYVMLDAEGNVLFRDDQATENDEFELVRTKKALLVRKKNPGENFSLLLRLDGTRFLSSDDVDVISKGGKKWFLAVEGVEGDLLARIYDENGKALPKGITEILEYNGQVVFRTLIEGQEQLWDETGRPITAKGVSDLKVLKAGGRDWLTGYTKDGWQIFDETGRPLLKKGYRWGAVIDAGGRAWFNVQTEKVSSGDSRDRHQILDENFRPVLDGEYEVIKIREAGGKVFFEALLPEGDRLYNEQGELVFTSPKNHIEVFFAGGKYWYTRGEEEMAVHHI